MAAKHFETNFRSYDNLNLYSQGWEPEDQPAGGVALVHGLGEHSGRYAHLGSFLAERGIALQSFDLRGHGKSDGKRGDTPSFEAYIKDIDVFLKAVRDRFRAPLFLYGHSLGSILVVTYVLNRKPSLTGVICTGLGLHNALEHQTFKIALVKTLGNLFPNLIIPSGLDPNALSRDTEVVKNYINDPLVHDRASLGFGAVGLKMITTAWQQACDFPVPLLLMHGEKDQLAYPSSSTEFAELVPGECTLKLWEGMYHEVHNEFGKEQVFEFLLEWLNQIIEKPVSNKSI